MRRSHVLFGKPELVLVVALYDKQAAIPKVKNMSNQCYMVVDVYHTLKQRRIQVSNE